MKVEQEKAGGHRGPTVSVIIPVYNTEKYLADCVRSVQAQTYENLEILLVDDGSTDGSRRLCEELEKGDERIRLLVQDHKGVSAARNRGLDAHTGEYVFFMDSDDLIHPALIEQYVLNTSEGQADLIFCNCFPFVGPLALDELVSVVPEPVCYPPQKNLLYFRLDRMRGIGGKFIRSRFMGDLRFDERIRYGEDAFLNYQMLMKGGRVLFFNATWYYYRQRPDGTVATAHDNIGIELEHIKRLRDCEYAGIDAAGGDAFNALRRERELLAALRGDYLRAKKSRRRDICQELREWFLAEKEHPLLQTLPYRERVAFRLCFMCPPAYKAASEAVRLSLWVREKTASVMKHYEAPVCTVSQRDGGKRIAITFDVTYGADNTETILHILEENQVRATYFVSGIWADAFPDMAAVLRDRGCEVMSHANAYISLSRCREEELQDELEIGSRKIEAVTGSRPTLMRCPFGNYDMRVLDHIKKMGMKAVQWSVDSLDREAETTEEEICRNILSQIRPGGIIRCNNGGRYTPGALARVIPSLKEKGYQIVTVSELLSSGETMG